MAAKQEPPGIEGKERDAAMGRLTTHVLDTASGRPAAGLKIELWSHGKSPTLVKTATTNDDGRTDAPILSDGEFGPGTYELRFHAGDYLRRAGAKLDDPAFLDVIPIRFGIANANQHYHVPLLLSPYGYSTYRGS
jgi:5-hydroxyisourate hydrolase